MLRYPCLYLQGVLCAEVWRVCAVWRAYEVWRVLRGVLPGQHACMRVCAVPAALLQR
jgi:hypothetical protein